MTTDNTQLETLINAAWEDRANLTAQSAPQDIRAAVDNTITQLNNGSIRVASRQGVGQWTVHQWIKKAVLLSFKLNDNELMRAGELGFFDKVKTKFSHLSEAEMRATGIRVVPPAPWILPFPVALPPSGQYMAAMPTTVPPSSPDGARTVQRA